MKKVVSTLEQTLELLEINPHYLSKKANVRSATIYYIINNKSTRINTLVVGKILDVLNEVAKEKGLRREFNVEDVIKYK